MHREVEECACEPRAFRVMFMYLGLRLHALPRKCENLHLARRESDIISRHGECKGKSFKRMDVGDRRDCWMLLYQISLGEKEWRKMEWRVGKLSSLFRPIACELWVNYEMIRHAVSVNGDSERTLQLVQKWQWFTSSPLLYVWRHPEWK